MTSVIIKSNRKRFQSQNQRNEDSKMLCYRCSFVLSLFYFYSKVFFLFSDLTIQTQDDQFHKIKFDKQNYLTTYGMNYLCYQKSSYSNKPIRFRKYWNSCCLTNPMFARHSIKCIRHMSCLEKTNIRKQMIIQRSFL